MLFCVFYFSGMSILQEIQVSGTRRNPFADVALQNLLNSNLSAKYSLTGHLNLLRCPVREYLADKLLLTYLGVL
jgi:hypothetical protein